MFRMKAGDIYICTYAASPWYEVGKEYPIIKNDKEELCVMAKDGLLDPVHMATSKFRPKDGPRERKKAPTTPSVA
jgi:hypothetical protein